MECENCGNVFHYCRTMERPPPKPGECLCGDCEMYRDGYIDGRQDVAMVQKENEKLRRQVTLLQDQILAVTGRCDRLAAALREARVQWCECDDDYDLEGCACHGVRAALEEAT